MSIGKRRVILLRSADADVVLRDVVVRREIGVRNRPVLTVSVVTVGSEIEIAQTIALPAPHHGPSAHDAQPLPGERLVLGRAVGIFQIVDKPIVVVLHARVALLLDRPRLHDLRRHIAEVQLVGRHVLGEFGRRYIAPRFEQRHRQTGFRKSLGSPASSGARSHYNRIESLRQIRIRHDLCSLWFAAG